MHNKVNILFELVTPFRLCSDLGIPVKSRGRSCVIKDPLSKEDIYITDVDFIPKQMGSKFIGGNIVDFLAYVKEISHE